MVNRTRDKKGRFIKGHTSLLTDESRKKMSKNSARYWKGKKHSKETKRKISITRLGKRQYEMTDEIKQKISNTLKGHEVSIETRDKIRKSLWKCEGGRTTLIESLRHTPEYKKWRTLVFERDNYTCQDCGVRGGYLEGHHKQEVAFIFDEHNIQTLKQALNCKELWNISNGETLCRKCHNKTKKGCKTI